MEEKITAWIARDKDGRLYLYIGVKPYKRNIKYKYWSVSDEDDEDINNNHIEYIPNDTFPQVKWEDDEPTKVELTIKIEE